MTGERVQNVGGNVRIHRRNFAFQNVKPVGIGAIPNANFAERRAAAQQLIEEPHAQSLL